VLVDGVSAEASALWLLWSLVASGCSFFLFADLGYDIASMIICKITFHDIWGYVRIGSIYTTI
jgi:hypothetical protein